MKWRVLAAVILVALACSRVSHQPSLITHVILLSQTDGRRCEDLPPHQVEMISDGSYAFLLGADELQAPDVATITLYEGSPSKRRVLWRKTEAHRNDSFGVLVPASYVTDGHGYQFTLTTVDGAHIGEFAFRIIDASTRYSQRNALPRSSPCD